MRYQLEDNELAAEPLPDSLNRRSLLFYEAAEGGAGVLRRLVDEPQALAEVARLALEICHFDADTGEDRQHAQHAEEDCEAACYDCLLSYSNQREHAILDRQTIRDLLLHLAGSRLASSPTAETRESHLGALLRQCESDLEREWLDYLAARHYRLPDAAQALFDTCAVRCDFLYSNQYAIIFVDGSYHDYPERQQRDRRQTDCLEDSGYSIIRFGYRDNWDEILQANHHIFGSEA